MLIPSAPFKKYVMISSVQFSVSVMSHSCWPHGLQHARLPCPSPSPEACSNSFHWVADAIQPSHPLPSPSPPALNLSQHQSFPVSQIFTSGGQGIGASASASVLPMNIQGWFPLGLTGLICLQSKEISRVFFNTIVQKWSILWCSAFFMVQLSHPY